MNSIEESAEFEDLLDYLRKKSEDRRLKAIDQVDDNKINEMIRDEAIPEVPEAEGEKEKVEWSNDTYIKSMLSEEIFHHELCKLFIY